MGVSDKLTSEIKGIAILVIIIVVFSIVLNKFKDVDGNSTATNASITSAVGYLDDPITWISIIIIIIVIAWLMKYLKSTKSM